MNLLVFHDMNEFNLEQFYELTALCQYNSERRGLLQPLIKKFFSENSDSFDINKKFITDSIYKTVKSQSKSDILEELFIRYDSLFTSSIDFKTIIDFIILRYGKCREAFLKKYHIPLEYFIYISLVIWETYFEKLDKNPHFTNYQFDKKEDYLNLNFYVIPSDKYIDTWKKISTVNCDDLLERIKPLNREILNKYLELYSFDLEKIRLEPDLRFREYPLFFHDDKIILVDPQAFFIYLPHKFDILLSQTKSHESKKGKLFEKIVLDLIEEVPNKKSLDRNIKYGEFELDGLLNLKRSTWFIECKSRNVSTQSLRGKRNKISKDIERSIESGIKQGERDIKYMNSEYMKNYDIKNFVGIIVVLEGIFPNIRLKALPDNPLEQCRYPVCVFNYFDLRTILNQHDSGLFEEFLIWRSQRNMPVYALDECDYWDFYTKMKKNKDLKKTFKFAQQNDNIIIHIGNRFNDKKHISNFNT